jgi:hypothetical protein
LFYIFYQIWQSTTSIGAMHRMGVETSFLSVIPFHYIREISHLPRSYIPSPNWIF